MIVTQGGRKPSNAYLLSNDATGGVNPVSCTNIQQAARQADIAAQDLRANRTQDEAHASGGHDNQPGYAKIRPGQRRMNDTTTETPALRQAGSDPLAGSTECPYLCGGSHQRISALKVQSGGSACVLPNFLRHSARCCPLRERAPSCAPGRAGLLLPGVVCAVPARRSVFTTGSLATHATLFAHPDINWIGAGGWSAPGGAETRALGRC